MEKRYLKEFVYGATDGTITTFAIIAGVMGASLAPVIVLFLGISNVFADAFSMAASNYLSEERARRSKTAAATFISFVLVGMIPLVPFVIGIFAPEVQHLQFGLSIAATAVAFMMIGFVRGRVRDGKGFRSMLETLAIGGIAALIAFSVGFLLKEIVPQ